MALRRMQVSDVPTLRGVNWYGMEDGLRGPTLAELQSFASAGFNFVRLPVRYDTTNAAIATVLADAETAGVWLGVEVHNYGRIGGTASINATDGTVITSANQQTWFDKCANQLSAFGSYLSYVPLDMNEPKQTGLQWEPISRGRVAALRAAGWAGPIGVSAARLSSAGGINNSDAHPGGWWITDSGAFLEVHQYLQGLTDTFRQTQADLNSWVVNSSGQADLTTYVQYINRAFGWGAMGDSRWASVPMLIGEFAMPPGCETELEAFLDKVDARGVGAIQWAGGMWPDSYAWKISAAQLTVLSSHIVATAPLAALSDTFDALDPARWVSSGTPAPVIASARLSCTVSASYPTITSVARYNLTASQFFVELVQPSTTAATAQVVFMLTTQAVSKAGLEFVLDAATTLRARRWVSNTATELNNVAYSSTNHRWLRIAEAGGTVSFQTSPDAVTWATLATISTATLTGLGIDITQLKVSLGAGYYGTETTPGTALFDNLNTVPAAAPPPPPPPAPPGGRQNLAPNPSCKNDATGWSAVDASTGSPLGGWGRSTSVGAGLPRTTGFEGTNSPLDILTPRAQVVAGQQYYWAVWVRALADLSSNMLVNYYAAPSGGSFVGNSGSTVPLTLSSGSTARFVLGPYTVPAGAVSGYLKLNDLDGACEVTGYQVERASTFAAYFDGDSVGGTWDGTAGNSTSSLLQVGSQSGGDSVGIGESFTKTVTAVGPTFADAFGVGASFTIAAGSPSTGLSDLVRVRDGFLISSLEWDPGKGRNRVSAFTFAATVTQAVVSRQRVQGGGAWDAVRGGTVAVAAGFMVRPVDDYEFPSGVDLDYRIEGVTAAGTVVQTATVRRRSLADAVWLKFITQPSLNQQLEFMGRTEITRPSRTAVYDVQGRPDPVVVSDVHSSRRMTIRCKAETPAAAEVLDHALAQGLPCYLQVPETINTPSMYAVVGDYQWEAPAPRSMRSVFTIPLVEVSAPTLSTVSPGETWAQLLVDYATWELVMAAAPRWLNIAD